MSDQMQVKFSHIDANGIRLHVAQAGEVGRPLLFLLHGFPDFWYGWRKQIEPLVEAGFHVVVPDQRGYNLTEKPRRLGDYRLPVLVGDIVALADHFGAERFCVAGHDWGGIVGWWMALTHPMRLKRLVVLNAAHPVVWKLRMKIDPEQRSRSRYVRFFQLPLVPEAVLRVNDYEPLADALTATFRPDAVTAADLIRYRDVWSRPGALTAMLNWYRAIGRQRFKLPAAYRIHVPTLILWGAHDKYATYGLADESARLCDQARLIVFDHASHWAPVDVPELVADHIQEFCAS